MGRLAMFGLVLALLVTAGCSPATEQASTQIIPTIFPSATPDGHDLESAERVARLFLDAWQRGAFEEMYELTTFASQDATPLPAFTAAYETAYSEMTLKSVRYAGNTLYREAQHVVVLNYDAAFTTEALGEFTDSNRNLHVVIDERTNDWRVAWTPGDIFAEMEGGNSLKLERFGLRRANIYDRDGQVLADQLGRVAAVSVIKEKIPDYEACVNLLVQTTGRPLDVIRATLNESAPNWLAEMGTVESETYIQYHDQLETVCNAQFKERFTRRYLNGTLAPHVVGYVGYPSEADLPALKIAGFDQDSILGKAGIEKSWDEYLRGKPGGRLVIVTPAGQVLREVVRVESQQSQSVWLTLDSDLQQYVLQVIGEAYASASSSWALTSKGAAVVVMDLNTGEILALVSWPTYDANALAPFPAIGREVAEKVKQEINDDPLVPLLNRATQGQFPPGSVMKTVDTIAVADSGVYTIDQSYTCVGSWNRDIFRTDWLPSGHGKQTLPEGLMHSCNPYFYEVGYQLDQVDPWILPNYARKLGLGSLTGQQDLSESPGTIGDPEWKRINTGLNWTFSDAVNMAVGQGFVEVTPLQIARLFALVGNGGKLLRPQFVQQVGIIGEAPSYVFEPDVMDTVAIKPDVMDTLRTGLCGVTSVSGGTAEHIFRRSALQSIGVCGKTGTAQAAQPDDVSHAWFAAYAPRENPQIAIAVIIENSGEGSAVAAPVVRRILEYYFFGPQNP